METELILRKIADDITEIKVRLSEIDDDLHREVRPEYIKKLKRIEKQEGRKFKTKEEFIDYLEHGLWDKAWTAKDSGQA